MCTKVKRIRCMKTTIGIALIVLLFALSSIAVSAASPTRPNKTATIYASTQSDYLGRVETLLENGADRVDVIFSDLKDEEELIALEDKPQNSLKSVGPIRTYYIKNVRKGSDYVGNYRLASADGAPGITLSISKRKSVETTVSGTFGATYKAISAAVGWSVSGSTSVSVQGSYKVPYTYGGKRVKWGYLDAYPKYKTKLYDVYYGIQGTSSEVKKGTGTTRKAIGVSFKKRHTYK